MTARLQCKTIVVTAAAGIGRESAILCMEEGASVWAVDIVDAGLDTLRTEHPAINTQKIDVTDPHAIDALVAATGDIDVLFNCAGFVHNGTIMETDVRPGTSRSSSM